jgi:protein dithiol:quinone oxidoreductase
MLVKLANIGRGAGYWLFLIVLGLAMEGTALFYQHVVGLGPCVLCIQTRIWVLAIILLALVSLGWRTRPWLVTSAHLLMTALFLGLLDRSWLLFGTERGFVISDCGFDLGLPTWLALEDWFPAVFRIEEACGYTPELLFGITMAEALLVMSSLLVLLGAVMTIAAFVHRNIDSVLLRVSD